MSLTNRADFLIVHLRGSRPRQWVCQVVTKVQIVQVIHPVQVTVPVGVAMIQAAIKKERLLAMKSGNKPRRSTLTTLLGAIETEEKRGNAMDDTSIIALLKKWIANADENFRLTSDVAFEEEKAIYQEFLPKQLSDDELSESIDQIISELDNANIGSVMSNLKLRHPGLFDGKTASTMIRTKLQG